jgi:diguanylate cyclase (GGDEF)-like protein
MPPTKEFSALMLSFNHMAQQIEKDKLELSQKVNERTIELKEAEEKSRNLANLDFITGLANRMSAINTLEKLTDKQEDFALLFIDLDNFKPINDKYGHITGDRLLQAVARRIRSENTRKNNLAARYGGDEFLIIIHRPGDLDNLMSEVNQILDLLTTPYIIDGLELHIGACIGITRNIPTKKTTADQLIHQADQAMYHAKERGKNKAILYSSTLKS